MGSNAFTFSDGADQSMTSDLYTWPTSSARRIPVPVLGDDFSLIQGSHTWQWGGTFKDILAHTTNVSDYNIAEIGLGGQVLGLCGPAAKDCDPNNPNETLRPSDIDTSNELLWDEAFSYSLGRIGNVQSTYNYDKTGNSLKQMTGDQRYYRSYQMQLYVQDTWKVLPSLTLNYGLNYQWFSVPYETRGLETVEPYTFNEYMSARVMQSQLGQTGADAVPLISYLLGGKGNGSSAPGLYQPEYRNIAPHVGFDWNPGFDKKMVINGSAAVIYDRTVVMALQSLQDSYSYLFQQLKTISNGTSGDPYTSLATDPRLDANNGLSNMTLSAPATPKPPYQPYVDSAYCASLGIPTSPCGLIDGGAFNSATIDPSLKTPYSLMFNFGVQRTLPWNMVVKANFVSRLGRRLLAQADAEQIIDFVDTQSGQEFSDAFSSVVKQIRQGTDPANVTVQPWFENVYQPGRGVAKGYASNTNYLAAAYKSLFYNGDFADFNQGISYRTPLNVGMAAQFSENSFYYNGGFSNYDGLLFTLSKNLSHGLQYDFNYTFSHSIDNISFFANSQGDTGIGSGVGLICDVIRPRECRARSDFDMRHLISADSTYQLPFGKGRMFLASVPHWTDEMIGAWDISGIAEFHSGEPWATTSNAFVASYSNDAPAIFVGTNSSVIKNHVTKLPGGGVSDFSNAATAAASFTGPVGFQMGPRNQMTGPRFFNADMGLQKTFPLYKEALNLKFRADAFNALNHPNFNSPMENAYNGFDQTDYQRKSGFGAISTTASSPGNENSGARVLQLSLRVEY
jgi:hypothetical protein